jgi:serine/threonine-protein kinase RsbW
MAPNDRVVLSVPARGEYARTVRLAAAELGVRAGMSIDDVDDVRLAVEEAFVYAADHAQGEQIVFTFVLETGAVELLVGPVATDCAEVAADDAGRRYARFILESICDEFEILQRDDGCYIRLVKRAA